MRPGRGSVSCTLFSRFSLAVGRPGPASAGENRGGSSPESSAMSEAIRLRCLIARELRDRSRRGGGLVLVRQSFVDVGHFPCLHSIQ